MVKEISTENFELEVLKSEIPVVVDFWASWCGPCKMMAPVFEEVSKDYEGKFKFVKVSTEDNQDLAASNNIRGIPCLVVFKDGKEFDRIVGYQPKDALKKSIDDVMSKLS